MNKTPDATEPPTIWTDTGLPPDNPPPSHLQNIAESVRDASTVLVDALDADNHYEGMGDVLQANLRVSALNVRDDLTRIVQATLQKEGAPYSNGDWHVYTWTHGNKQRYGASSATPAERGVDIHATDYASAVALVNALAEFAT